MLQVVTIYDASNGHVVTDGLQSSTVCDEAIQAARRIAKETRRHLVVEDVPARHCYAIGPRGGLRRKPTGWIPAWDQQE